MAKMLLRIPAIRGTVTLDNDEGDGHDFIMSANGFEDVSFTAETMDEAIQKAFSSVGMMKRTAEWKAKMSLANERRKQALAAKQPKTPAEKRVPLPAKQAG